MELPHPVRPALRRTVLSLGLCLGVGALPAAAAAGETVDMALVLAVDCSYSVDASEFRLQIKGLADAFRRSDIHAAIKGGSTGRIAVTLMQWSDDKNQLLALPWTVLIPLKPRRTLPSGSAISGAVWRRAEPPSATRSDLPPRC